MNSRNILVIEPDAGIAETIVSALSSGGYTPRAVATIADAAGLLDTTEFDGIVADLNLGALQGVDAYFAVRDLACELPVIVVSNATLADGGAEAVSRGAQDHLLQTDLSGPLFLRVVDYTLRRFSVQRRLDDLNRQEQRRLKGLLRKVKELYEKLDAANQEIAQELDIASEVQRGLYPRSIPQVEGLAISAEIQLAKQVGGDYYDILPVNDHEMAFLIVDVAGHDIASAFITGMAKISFSAHIHAYRNTADVLRHVNDDMLRVINSDRYISAFLAIVNTHDRTLRYARAGHFRQCLYRFDRHDIEFLTAEGMLLGAFENGGFEEKTVELTVGDKLVLFTDGIFENTDARLMQYGEKRLHDFIRREGGLSGPELHDLIVADHRTFTGSTAPHDDVCLLTVEIKETAATRRALQLFDGEQLTIPPIRLVNRNVAAEGLTMILDALDRCGYPDELIRHYKKVLFALTGVYLDSRYAAHELTAFVRIDEYRLRIVLDHAVPAEVEGVFHSTTVRQVLLHFSSLFGTAEVNETGSRLTLSYRKPEAVAVGGELLLVVEGSRQLMTVPMSGAVSFASVKNDLIARGVLNADWQAIENSIHARAGKPVDIGPAFRLYDHARDALVGITAEPMRCSITFRTPYAKETAFSVEELRYLLLRAGVTTGIDPAALTRLAAGYTMDEPYTVAVGTPPVDGYDASIAEIMDVDATMQPLVGTDGRVDFKNIDNVRQVKAGAVILRKTPAFAGTSGVSVFGRTIDAYCGADVRIEPGENTILSPDGLLLSAAVDGYIYREAGGIHVRQILNCTGDVDYATGNIDYQGDVHIAGKVLPGFIVKAGKSLVIDDEVEAAELCCSQGSIECAGGIVGKNRAVLTAAKNIRAVYLQETAFSCGGSLFASRQLLRSSGTVGGDVVIEERRGSIIGGEITCLGSVRVAQLGSESGDVTTIILRERENPLLREKLVAVNQKLADIRLEYSTVSNQLGVKSRIFKVKDPRKRTPEEKEEVERLLKEFYRIKKQLEGTESFQKFLEAKERRECTFGSIIVSQGICPGTVVKAGKTEKIFQQKMGPTVLVVENGKILMKPYREEDADGSK